MENNNSKSDLISYKELIYFKEEIFHSLKDFRKEVAEKTNEQLTQFNTKLEETKSLLSNNKNESNIFITKEEFQAEKKDILNKQINKAIVEDKLTEFEIQISAIRKDISEACYKYDKIFIDQLTLPGIIGDKCKYPSVKDYIKNNIHEMSNISTMNLKALNDIRIMKGKLENRINEFGYQIEGIKQQYNHIINLKLVELENKINDRLILIEDKIKKIIYGESNYFNLIDNNNENDTINNPFYDNINKLKKELMKKMNETNEKSKKMDLTVLRELEVAKSEFNYVKKTLYELAKVLMMELEDGEGFKSNKREILNNFITKNKILELNNTTPNSAKKKKVVNQKSIIFPQRKDTYSLTNKSGNQKNNLFHRMKTGIFYVKKRNPITTNLDSPRDIFKEDENLDSNGNDSFKNDFIRQNTIKKKSMRNKLNLDLNSFRMTTINENHDDEPNNNNNDDSENENENEKEKKIVVKSILKQTNYMLSTTDNNKSNNLQLSINDSKEDINLNTNKTEEINKTENEINKTSLNINDFKKITINKNTIENNNNNQNNINNNNTNYNINDTSSSINTNINIKTENKNLNQSTPLYYNKEQVQKTQVTNSVNFLKIKSKKTEFKDISNRSLPTFNSQKISSFRNKNKIISLQKKKIPSEPIHIESVPDSEIIDIPLIPSNKNYLEIEKNKSVVEKKIIELEFFTKKKFDELVNEIKNFIPIHFNSYIRDYKIIESPVKKRNFRQISFEKNQYSHF